MRLKAKVERIVEGNAIDFSNVEKDFSYLNTRIDGWARQHKQLNQDFYDLEDELATNGVVRDIRAMQKELAELRQNGVATAINKLNAEVFESQKESENISIFERLSLYSEGREVEKREATLAGKVDAIIAHLGLDVEVKPEEVTEAKVVAKKLKTTKKKAGRR